MSFIYESPDKGKTVYRRKFGEVERELVSPKRTAEVFEQAGAWGVKFYKDGELVLIEHYPFKGKHWAESAAENYIMGVKKINETN